MKVWELVVAFLGGGAVSGFLQYLLGNKNSKRDDFKVLVDALQDDNSKIRDLVEKLQSKVTQYAIERETLHAELIELRASVQLLESAHQDLPLPMWLEDMSGRMLAVNMAYEENFLIPLGLTASDYMGKLDTEIWPDVTAKQFMGNDEMVKRTGQVWRGTEVVPTKNGDVSWTIIKYVRYAGRTKIGVAGLAIPVAQ
jgi:hypothetical protein